ncbi:MAG: NADPH-dependent assimilatory sulfite reductase hemoprotein subunit [Candidatus Sumerlaeia bacterium]|nr:NADPH-dependent assimilatory sulfite reductase hemoprotein subunit [Candidatus Sumerlaeia bacterium]
MSKGNAEDLKRQSRHLRGTIAGELASSASHLSDAAAALLKFHGSYQQDDRDLRQERLRDKRDKEWIFMVRSKIPGGALTAAQYLVHDRICGELGNGTLRITSRQGLQTHGVIKGHLKTVIQRINASGITTWGACGDVVRNCMATPEPLADEPHRAVQTLARELATTFAAASHAYSEIWLDGEKVSPGQETEPIYGEAYLPRKFKFGIAVPPRNDIDVLSNDVGIAALVDGGRLTGYSVWAGGGMGMTHGKEGTFPALALPLFSVDPGQIVDACVAIVTTQRDFGGRSDRKHARLKYLIADRGLDWFRAEVTSRMRAKPREFVPVTWTSVQDRLGWHGQGDGRLFLGLWVQDGRIKDNAEGRYRTGLRLIAERFGRPLRLTANCNLYLHDIEPAQRPEIDAVLADHGIVHAEGFTEAKKVAMACVALPTCGLALAESERAFPELFGEIDRVLRDLGLEREQILVRMTGCPNGCARPYNADFGIVGRSPGKYALYIGGSHTGERLAGLLHRTVEAGDIPGLVRACLEQFVAGRRPGESFSTWWGRTQLQGEAPTPEQFHEELAERAKRLAGSRAEAE